MPDHPWMKRLHELAAERSIEIEQARGLRWLRARRTVPGMLPLHLETKASRDTPGGWDSAARTLHTAILADTAPNNIPDDWLPS